MIFFFQAEDGIRDYSSTKLKLIGQHTEVSPQTGAPLHGSALRPPCYALVKQQKSFLPKRDRLYPPGAGPVRRPPLSPPAGVAFFSPLPHGPRWSTWARPTAPLTDHCGSRALPAPAEGSVRAAAGGCRPRLWC